MAEQLLQGNYDYPWELGERNKSSASLGAEILNMAEHFTFHGSFEHNRITSCQQNLQLSSLQHDLATLPIQAYKYEIRLDFIHTFPSCAEFPSSYGADDARATWIFSPHQLHSVL
ncbi:hypothetical protein ACMFMF_005453 [Clarireedia jacksonii]